MYLLLREDSYETEVVAAITITIVVLVLVVILKIRYHLFIQFDFLFSIFDVFV